MHWTCRDAISSLAFRFALAHRRALFDFQRVKSIKRQWQIAEFWHRVHERQEKVRPTTSFALRELQQSEDLTRSLSALFLSCVVLADETAPRVPSAGCMGTAIVDVARLPLLPLFGSILNHTDQHSSDLSYETSRKALKLPGSRFETSRSHR